MLHRARLPLLLVLVVALYAPSLGNGFANDDRYVAKAFTEPGRPNDMVHTLKPVSEYFGALYWPGQELHNPLYRPVTVLSFALVYHWLGSSLSPEREGLPQHLLNVILHAACTWLVLLLLRPFTGDGWATWLGAAAFGLNAIHVESVAAIFGRAELMSFGFGALGLLLWLRGWESRLMGGIVQRLLAAACLFLAVCSKETGLVWLPLWWLYAVARGWARGDEARRPLLLHGMRAVAVGALPVLAFFLLRDKAMEVLQARQTVPWVMNPLAGAPLLERLLTATMLWGYGLYKVMLPLFLCSDWGASVFESVTSPLDPRFLGAAAALGTALALGVVMARRVPPLFVAVAAFFGFGFLTSNLPFAIGIQFAERLYFSPSLALAFTVAWAASKLAARPLPARIGLVTLALWSVASAWVIVCRCPVWRDDPTLYTHDVAIQPRSMFLRINAANVARAAGDFATWERHLREAVAIEPRFARGWHDLARGHLERFELGEAEVCLRRGLTSPTAHPQKDLPMLHFDVGFVEAHTGRPAEAAKNYATALELDWKWFTTMLAKFFFVARVRLASESVLAILERGQQLAADDPRWMLLVGMQLVSAGRLTEAAPLLRRALPLVGDFELALEGWLDFGRVLLAAGKLQEGTQVLRSLTANPNVPQELRARAEELLRQR